MKMNLIKSSLLISAIILCTSTTQAAPKSTQVTFKSASEAVSALESAVSKGDDAALSSIFGPSSGPLLFSGDAVEDQNHMEEFSKLFTEKNQLEKESEDRYTLLIGNEEWPFPIPVVSRASGWQFDTEAGAEEILNRRIGRNELAAIEMCKNYVAAQQKYFAKDQDGDGYNEYAQKFLSDRGRHNGLFWARKPGDYESPLGPVIAQAIADGYQSKAKEGRTPLHGYYFKILTSQGAAVAGGKKNYITNGGRLTEGFALIAFPAIWDNSGIMSFIVNQEGKIYQRNLGKNSIQIAESMKEYNPDSRWTPVE